MYKGLAIIEGALIAIMVLLNGVLASYVGDYFGVAVVHFVGLVAMCLLFLARGIKIENLKGVPWFLFTAGFIGVFNVLLNNLCFATLGVTVTLGLGLLGQSIASCIVDHFGIFGVEVTKFNKSKLIGLGFIIVGIIIMVY